MAAITSVSTLDREHKGVGYEAHRRPCNRDRTDLSSLFVRVGNRTDLTGRTPTITNDDCGPGNDNRCPDNNGVRNHRTTCC